MTLVATAMTAPTGTAPHGAAIAAIPVCAATAENPAMQRARGRAAVTFRVSEGATRLERLYQEGQAKIRLPRAHGGEPVSAVLINTAGGVTGGDRFAYEAVWREGTRAVVTGQAAERIYRSSAGAGRIDVRLVVEAGATAEWLPQETILFDAGRIERRLEAEVAADARLTVVETVVFGRVAMGERIATGSLVDHWRIRRAGRLAFADSFSVSGDVGALMAGRATGAGARAVSTFLHMAPDAADHLDRVRAALDTAGAEGAVEAGATAFDGLLVVRMISPSPQALRSELVRFLEIFRSGPLPRPWSC